jgi:hypothetical protein
MRLQALFLSLVLLGGCTSAPVKNAAPIAASQTISQKLNDADAKNLDQLAGIFTAIIKVNAGIPESLNKYALFRLAEEGLRNTGLPALETKTKFDKIAEQLTSESETTRAAGESKLQQISAENAALRAAIAELRQSLAAELAKQHSEMLASVAKAKAEAETAERRFIGWICFGGAAILAAMAGLVFFLGGSIPFAGPKAALGLGAGSALLFGAGLAYQFIRDNPWIMYAGFGLAFTTVLVSVGLMWANHHHGTGK